MNMIYAEPIQEDVYNGITFSNTAVNRGTINGGARFINNSANYAIINGDAIFLDDAQNYGEQAGVTIYDPPLIAQWVRVKWSSNEPWIARRIVAYPSKNPQLGASLWGPTQPCPSPDEGCYDDPETYRPLVKFNYVLENQPDEDVTVGDTLYYKPSTTATWDNLRNWSTSSSRFVQAPELPTATDSVVMNGACLSNGGGAPTVANLTFSSLGQARVFAVDITVTGTATFAASAINTATITGNALFTDYSYNAASGNIVGNATFSDGAANLGNISGTATFTDFSCNSGGTAGNFVPNPPPVCFGFSTTTLYYKSGSTTNWFDLDNWYTDSGFVYNATELPGPANNVVITGPVFGAGDAPIVANLSFTDSTDGAIFNTTIIVTGTATFSGNGVNGAKIAGTAAFVNNARNSGAIFGDATFSNDSSNYGEVSGTATFLDNACNQKFATTYVPDPPPAC